MTTSNTVPDALCKFVSYKLKSDIPGKATDARVRQTERVLGVKLPASYVAALKVRNGGSLLRKRFKLKKRLQAKLGYEFISVQSLAGVHPTHMNALTQSAALAAENWGCPKGLVPFDGDGHSCVCLDYRKDSSTGNPRITLVDHHSETMHTIAPSFDALLQGLYRDREELDPALISLEKPTISKPRLNTLLLTLGCKRHTLPGRANPKYPHPPTWTWSKYAGRISGLHAWIQFERNKLYSVSIAKTRKRPAMHPMLTVAVSDADEEACLAELLAALGNHATLVERSM